MNRQDFDKWATNTADDVYPKSYSTSGNGFRNEGFKMGAISAYNLLSKEISEKNLEIVRLKLLIKMIWMKEFDLGNNWQQFKKDNQL
jgi:hypothetical protein